jgi:ribonuclease R
LARKASKKTAKSGAGKKAAVKEYQHPIPDRYALLGMLESAGRPVTADHLLAEIGRKGQRMRGLLVEKLYKMVRAGQVIENRRGEFCLTAKLDLLAGTVSGGFCR